MAQFAAKVRPPVLVTVAAVVMCLTSAAIGAMAYGRWRDNEIAMRHKRALPHSQALILVSSTALCTCALIACLVIASFAFP